MIGVILWTDVTDRKAVIWCEDQGDLAFLKNGDGQLDADDFFEVGDVVRFDVKVDRNLRLACDAQRVNRNWGTTLRDCLTDIPAARGDVRTSDSAKIIPFRTDGPEPMHLQARNQQIG